MEGQQSAERSLAVAIGRAEIWAGVDRLIDRAPSLADIRSHGLHLLAAMRWRHLGRDLPDQLAREETVAAWLALATPYVLTRVRNAYDGQLIVMKGPEAAGRYPDPATRPYADLDILADDPEAAQKAWARAASSRQGSKTATTTGSTISAHFACLTALSPASRSTGGQTGSSG